MPFNFITSDKKIFVVDEKFISYSPLLYTMVTTDVSLDICQDTGAINLDGIADSEDMQIYLKWLYGQLTIIPTELFEKFMRALDIFGHPNTLGMPSDIFGAKAITKWFRDNHKIHPIDPYHGLIEVPIQERRFDLLKHWTFIPKNNVFIAGSFAMYLAGYCEDPRDIDIFTTDKNSLQQFIEQTVLPEHDIISVGKNCLEISFRTNYNTEYMPETRDYDSFGKVIGGIASIRHFTLKELNIYNFRRTKYYVYIDKDSEYFADFCMYANQRLTGRSSFNTSCSKFHKFHVLTNFYDAERDARYEFYETQYEEYVDFGYSTISDEEFKEFMKTPKTFIKNICEKNDHRIVSGRSVLYHSGIGKVQYVLKEYSSPAEIIHFFDLDCCGFLYDPTKHKLWATQRALVSVKNMANYFDPEFASRSYGYRLAKYTIRGFEPWLPFYDKLVIDKKLLGHHCMNYVEYNMPHVSTCYKQTIKEYYDDDSMSFDYMSIMLAAKLFNWIVPQRDSVNCITYDGNICRVVAKSVFDGETDGDPDEERLMQFIQMITDNKTKKQKLHEIHNTYPEPFEADILEWYEKSPYVTVNKYDVI